MFRAIWAFIVTIVELICFCSAISVCFGGGNIADLTAGICAGVLALYLQRYRESLETPVSLDTLVKIRDAFKKEDDKN